MRTSVLTITNIELGRPHIVHHPLAAQPASLGECGSAAPLTLEAWRRGEMMRFGTLDPGMLGYINRLQPMAMQAKAGQITPANLRAWLDLQNMTRRWIEELVTAARVAGFDALIGREVDSHRKGGPVACDVLFALTDRALEPPRWLF